MQDLPTISEARARPQHRSAMERKKELRGAEQVLRMHWKVFSFQTDVLEFHQKDQRPARLPLTKLITAGGIVMIVLKL